MVFRRVKEFPRQHVSVKNNGDFGSLGVGFSL